MKAVILAGGLGTRISEETDLRPKPMIEIGGKPILWHIMKIYSAHGINDFIICCGYRGYMIKEYFANYFLHMSDVTLDIQTNSMEVHASTSEPWRVTLIDTGESTQTGGRLRRVRHHLDDGPFCFTYGDAVSDVDISALVEYHQSRDKLVTVTAVQPAGRFGSVSIDDDGNVTSFQEKLQGDGGWINAGFAVVHPDAIDYIDSDFTSWEREPLERLTSKGQVDAFKHEGFWQPMDTLRDKQRLQELWEGPRRRRADDPVPDGYAPPWRVW